jgi:hypothetical protein
MRDVDADGNKNIALFVVYRQNLDGNPTNEPKENLSVRLQRT